MTRDDYQSGQWPADLMAAAQGPKEPTPREIIQAQAEDLKQKTEGLLYGKVEVGAQGQYIVLDFFIVAPRLDEYEYRLFRARHKLLPEYPVELILSPKDKRKAGSPDKLLALLTEVFASQSTLSVVGQLLELINRGGGEGAAA